MILNADLLYCLLPLSALFHVTEEFFFPGGFPEWYKSYYPQLASVMTKSYFIKVNAIFLGFSVLGLIKPEMETMEFGLLYLRFNFPMRSGTSSVPIEQKDILLEWLRRL